MCVRCGTGRIAKCESPDEHEAEKLAENGPPPSREVQDEEQQVNRLLAARVNYLKRQEAFLGTDPTSEEDNTQEFVKRLVRYSAAQAEVINAQNMILASIGLI